MNVMVTGGAGYIGSHAVKQLIEAGHRAVVVDNLFRGHRRAVPDEAAFYRLDLADTAALAGVLADEKIDCVMHFAALTYVGESVAEPLGYYHNNTAGAISLLRAMREAGVRRFVFSSTAAVYGEPERTPIVETCPQKPVNPYGWSKWCVEQILRDHAAADGRFAFVALRYFNVAGAAADGSLGEDHEPETHLIPLVLLAAMGRREKLTVFGTDYPTADGTCIRDYIHVEDLVAAHLMAMEALRPGDTRYYNLGIGRGLFGQGGSRRRPGGHGPRDPDRARRPPAGRPGGALRRLRQDPARARLVAPLSRRRRDHRDRLAVVSGASRRIRGLMQQRNAVSTAGFRRAAIVHPASNP